MECSNCHKNFCSKHLHDYNRCPNPKCGHIPFIYQSNPELKKKISDIINTCKICGQKCSNSQELKMHLKKCQMECSLCDFSGSKEMFWAHLIDKHKNQIIEKFKKNNNDNLNERNERDEEGFNIEEEEKNNEDFSNTVNLNQGSTYPQTNNNQFQIPITERNSNNVIKVNNLIYCNSKNNDIKCNCCPDHICKIGCCLCVECMKKNCIRLGLNKYQLINKEGRVATLCRGSYYCGYKYIKITKNVIGREFKNEVKCLNPGDPCESCKVLNKFMKEYSKIFFVCYVFF